jgi:hypothetical protein
MGWIPVALVTVLIVVIAIAMRRRHASPDSYADIETGTVSESWLAEQRGNKSDRLSP